MNDLPEPIEIPASEALAYDKRITRALIENSHHIPEATLEIQEEMDRLMSNFGDLNYE